MAWLREEGVHPWMISLAGTYYAVHLTTTLLLLLLLLSYVYDDRLQGRVTNKEGKFQMQERVVRLSGADA